MLHKSFQEMGIPPGYGFKKLLYGAQANALVVHAEGVGGWRPDRLYVRSVEAERYELVGSPAEMVSQDDPVVCSTHALLAYNTVAHSFRADANGQELHGANWAAVRVVDLRSRTEIHAIDRETLHLPDRDTEVWVSYLLAFTKGPETLHVVAAFRRDNSVVNYYVSELHLPTGLVRPLVNLPAVFL